MTYDNYYFLVWQIDYWMWMGCEIRYEWWYQDYYIGGKLTAVNYEKQKLDIIR